MTTATAPREDAVPDDARSALARLLAAQAVSLPHPRSILLLRHLQLAASASGAPEAETKRLSAALEQAAEHARRELPFARTARRWLRIAPGTMQRGLQKRLHAWLAELSSRELDELVPAVIVYLDLSPADLFELVRILDRLAPGSFDFASRRELGTGELIAWREVWSRERRRRQGWARAEPEAIEWKSAEPEDAAGPAESSAEPPPNGGDKEAAAEPGTAEGKSAEPEDAAGPAESSAEPQPNGGGKEAAAEPQGADGPAGDEEAASGNGGPGDAPPDEAPERHVETGFAREHDPGGWIDPASTLVAGERYWFWLEVTDQEVEGSIETSAEPIPQDLLEVGSRLTVVLFSLPGGLRLRKDAASGELKVAPDGTVRVERQPSRMKPPADARVRALLERRLFFPVTAPREPGPHTLRCSLYRGQTLVQSRLVRALVADAPGTSAGALSSTLDYTLSRTLRPAYLESIPDHRLSLMVNRNEDGTHGFFFKGKDEDEGAEPFTGTGVVGELEVQARIERARKSMRKAAWGNEDHWAKGAADRYQDGAVNLARLRDDLLSLAVAGLRLYRSTVTQLAEGPDRAVELHALMRTPGMVQIVNKVSPSFLLPASVFYDYDALDTGAPLSAVFELCPGFVQALQDADTPLERQPCFQGSCPSREEPRHVCPSGFWGFRHELGMPVSVQNGPEAAVAIEVRDAAFGIAVYRGLQRRAQHELALQKLAKGWGWNYADTRDEAIELLHEKHSQIVYFYCHGGYSNDAPYLQVGADGEGLIHPETLKLDLRWKDPQPLVFVNGCETAAVAPEQAFQFVRSLVETHNAAGVIGTEITVFEPLASTFAEEFFDRFLVRKRPLGEAVRGARLALLKRGNPLGLVYVPFALAGLHLEPA
ncbi:MAG: hypothetical protein ACJ8J0_24010 [Longimicrobiaceae bacterium]